MAKKKDLMTPPEEARSAAPEPVENEIPPIGDWTVNGRKVIDLPAHEQVAVSWGMTDQAIAMREAKIDRRYPKVEMLRDSSDLRLARFDDEDDDKDPMTERVDAVREPGMAYRFLSPDHRAGKRHYEIVKDAATGDPVKYRGMILGKQPIERQEARLRKIERRSAATLKQSVETMQVTQERAARDSRSEGIEVLRANDMLRDHTDPDRMASIGVTVSRGSQGADAAA